MRYFEHVKFRIITTPVDDIEKIRAVFTKLIPLDFEKEKLVLDEDWFENAQEDKQCIVSLQLDKQRHIREAISHMQFPATKLVEELETRVDENCHFFIRFDLESLFSDEWELTTGGRCLHCDFAVSSHPARRENAIETVRTFLNNLK